MERGEQVAAKTDDLDTRLTIAAHHEAGHIVIAAAMGLRLRPEGIMVDNGAWGLACFYKESDGSDESKESVIVATFAGYLAQKRFCEERGYSCPLPDDLEVTLSPDSKEARGIETNLSKQYLGNRSVPEVHELLQQRAAELVLRHWPAIEAVAREVASKSLAPLKPLKSGTHWSDQTSARSLTGDEVVKIVERFEIKAGLRNGILEGYVSAFLKSRKASATLAMPWFSFWWPITLKSVRIPNSLSQPVFSEAWSNVRGGAIWEGSEADFYGTGAIAGASKTGNRIAVPTKS